MTNKALSRAFRFSARSLKPKRFSMKTYFGFTPQRGNKWKHASGSFFGTCHSQKQQFASSILILVIF
jgi:hypothetical protein